MNNEYKDKEKLQNFEEEYASEVVPYLPEFRTPVNNTNEIIDYGSMLGYASMIISIVSLFSAPYVLGILGVIFGSVAIYEGSKGFGISAIVISTFSIIFNLIYTFPTIGLFI
ncbi:MAG: hypothetical protein K0S34_2092 [Bacillales bacterium]|jgi:hypothetical protein|nr:hypothetical protein [Bacillales bacterium]